MSFNSLIIPHGDVRPNYETIFFFRKFISMLSEEDAADKQLLKNQNHRIKKVL